MSKLPDSTLSLNRRRAIGAISALGAFSIVNCGGGSSEGTTSGGSTASSDASLSALVLSAGALSPVFAGATTSYSVSVTNGVSSLTITPTASSTTASIRVNGVVVASGAASAAINLAVGSNSVTVLVTAADGTTTRSYALTVVRAAASAAGNCALIPSETEGPYPLLAILSNSAIVRQDVRESKTGVPLTLNLTLENVNNLCAPISNAAVYIWHCDKDGEYSGYSSGQNGNHAGETYLRGIQVSDSAGQVSFTTVYPGWYAGRVTHIHAQIYLNDNLKVTATVTTQFAFPETTNATVYASSLYAAHGQNTSVSTNAADNVFSDGTSLQMLSLTGDVNSGFVASLTLGIAA